MIARIHSSRVDVPPAYFVARMDNATSKSFAGTPFVQGAGGDRRASLNVPAGTRVVVQSSCVALAASHDQAFMPAPGATKATTRLLVTSKRCSVTSNSVPNGPSRLKTKDWT